MRVIAGSAKGRKLKSPTTDETRPILDRVKTALFDTLMGEIVDTRFLDLFAGVGGIGIEALSRGAASDTFIELSPESYRLLRENLAITRLADKAETIRGDAFAFLKAAVAQGRIYDIVYVAPPQYHGMAARAVSLLDTEPLTTPGGLVIAQVHPRERADFADLSLHRLRLADERRYGATLLLYYEHSDVDAVDSEEASESSDGGEQIPSERAQENDNE